jgi:hypothetical protein
VIRYRYDDPAANLGLAMGTALALMEVARRPRPAPTPEQKRRLAIRDERAEWNAAVEAKKAAKRGRKTAA